VCSVVGALVVPFFVGRGRSTRRKGTIVASLLLASSSIGALTVGNHELTVISLAIQGLAAGALLPLLLAALLDLPEVDHRTSATAAGLFFTVGQIAGSASPIVVGWLEDTTGSFTSGTVLVSAVVALTIIPALRLAHADEP
jgi:cyanate permease